MAGRAPDPEKREKILSTAIALFLEKGYQGTTTEAIAKRANMSSSHMYIYFKDKAHLLFEAIIRMKEEHEALSTELAGNSVGLSNADFIEKFYEAQEAISHRVRFIASYALMPGSPAAVSNVDYNFSKVFMPFLKDWPEDLANQTASALMGISVGYFLFGDIEGSKAASLSVLNNAAASL